MRDPSLDDHHDLLRRARRLDESALSAIFDAFYAPLYRYVYHHTGHAATAEDLVAEVFKRLLEQFHRGDGPDRDVKAWLYRTAHNLIVDDSRRMVHRDHAQLEEDTPDAERDVSEQAGHALLAGQARAALARLTTGQRAVIILKYLEGLSNAEIAHVLSMPVGAVKALQSRGLAAMRQYLESAGMIERINDDAR